MALPAHEAGGFVQSLLPSPPPSSPGSNAVPAAILPQTRANPLKPGSQKISGLIDHIDGKLLRISRRFQKRNQPGVDERVSDEEASRGYVTFAEMAADLEAVTDIVWMSATPSIQIPYLLTIALTCSSSIDAFPYSPRAMFHLLRKLDAAFCSLMRGTNFDTGHQLPGFERGRGNLSTTEKVRLRGIVERTRVSVIEVAGKGWASSATSNAQGSDVDMSTDEDDVTISGRSDNDNFEMELARVYEHTIVELGVSLSTTGNHPFG